MKKTIRWMVLVWTVLTVPYYNDPDIAVVFLGLLYAGLVIGLMISDLREKNE